MTQQPPSGRALERAVSTLQQHLAEILSAIPSEQDLDEGELIIQLQRECGDDPLKTIAKLARSMRDDATIAQAVEQQAQQTMERAKRLYSRTQKKRETLLNVMMALGWRQIPAEVLPEMTVSMGYSPPKVIVGDLDELPSRFKRTRVSVEPDKLAIREAIEKDGEIVPGASLGNSEPHLRISGR